MLIPRLIGVGIILLELITDFELSLLKLVPMPVHIIIDIMAGILLAVSPFIFGFINEKTNAWLPHILVGLMIVTVSLLSDDKPEYNTNSK